MLKSQVLRSLPLSAASGLVVLERYFFVVADDDLHLYVFSLDDEAFVRRVRLCEGELPADKKLRKAQKPDFESLTLLSACDDYPHGALLAVGSGSTANRQQAVLIPLLENNEPSDTVQIINLAPLYAALSLADCNIEGAVVCCENMVLLQRGNQQQGSALLIVSLEDFLTSDAAVFAKKPPQMIPVSLPKINDVPLTFTDGALLSNGNILFSAVAEATNDSYNDGACMGTAIGEITACGELLRCEILQEIHKIEGIAIAQDGLLAVTDADDPDIAALLLIITFSLDA